MFSVSNISFRVLNPIKQTLSFTKSTFNIQKYAVSSFSRNLRHNDRRLMQIPAKVMYNVVVDVEKYVEFVPWCSKSLVTSKTPSSAKAKLVVGFGPIKEHYNSSLIYREPKFVKAICTDGRLFNLLDCTWKFQPGKNPETCIVDFNVMFEFRSMLYSRLATVFFNEVVLKMVSSFEKRAISQHRKILLQEAKLKTSNN